ncbi:MAG: NUDIX hydrolase [Myxococcota bacterium]
MSRNPPIPLHAQAAHQRWKTQHEEEHHDYRIFRTRLRSAEHPVNRQHSTFVILDCPDWVNVIALTEDAQVVLCHQYRHGTQKISLEIPGGMIDPGEAPFEAARRELREETGYTSQQWFVLGHTEPNPAFQTNQCWTFLALEASATHTPVLDTNELIETQTYPLPQIPSLIQQNIITHALVKVGFFYYLNHIQSWTQPSSAQCMTLERCMP